VSKRTLLLADDSVTIQKVVNLTFADEGIDVITVGDGDSAMEKISQLVPDVVLADVHMPGLSGYQICEILRGNPVTRDLPVVLLVGSFEPFDESEAARVGANAYLTKPFQSIRQLVSQVSDLMEASGKGATPEAVQGAAVGGAPAGQAPETNDIESLYHQSFAEKQNGDADAAAAPAPYVDAGMDDEMIETSHIEAPAEAESEIEPESAQRDEYVTSPDAHQPYSDEPNQEGAATYQQSETAEASTQDGETGAVADSSGSNETTEYDEFSRTVPAFESPSKGRASQMEEIDLLELPPIDNGKTLEFTTPERAMGEGSRQQVVSISPELMDIIVQKVIEKLQGRS
jgi:CheY-like chemotaxis protein